MSPPPSPQKSKRASRREDQFRHFLGDVASKPATPTSPAPYVPLTDLDRALADSKREYELLVRPLILLCVRTFIIWFHLCVYAQQEREAEEAELALALESSLYDATALE